MFVQITVHDITSFDKPKQWGSAIVWFPWTANSCHRHWTVPETAPLGVGNHCHSHDWIINQLKDLMQYPRTPSNCARWLKHQRKTIVRHCTNKVPIINFIAITCFAKTITNIHYLLWKQHVMLTFQINCFKFSGFLSLLTKKCTRYFWVFEKCVEWVTVN